MDKTRKAETVRLRCAGLTYGEVGKILGVSRQAAHQLCIPHIAQKDIVLRRADGKCEDCGKKFRKTIGDFHHVQSIIDPTKFGKAANLAYLCKSCHGKRVETTIERNKNRVKHHQPCLTSGCSCEGFIRGLCRNCYQVARKSIMEKKTSWHQLEISGKAYGYYFRRKPDL